tara:strand:- start:168 stop:902 length:735 start_codon:yes stop_codon:yes gene_type:complete
MKIYNYFSPNFDKKIRSKRSVKVIVVHYTGMQSERESIKRLCNPKSKVSSHFLINRKGKVYRLVREKHIAWHAGKSCWGKFDKLNRNSIGIELVNKGHKFGYINYKKKQLLSLIKVCKILIKKYKIKKRNIVGHSDISPSRKKDPGEKFPWKMLAEKNIGIWHKFDNKLLINLRGVKIFKKRDKKKFYDNLKKIGYCLENKNRSISIDLIKAFQRHYRQDLINGILDKECLVIAEFIRKILKNS